MSQDLFAAFNAPAAASLEPSSHATSATPLHTRQPSPLRASRGAKTPLSIDSTIRSPPTSTAVSAATTPVPPDPEAAADDDWGDFEDAAKPQSSVLPDGGLDDVLRARLGTPLDAKPDEYFFDTSKRALPKSVPTAPKSPPLLSPRVQQFSRPSSGGSNLSYSRSSPQPAAERPAVQQRSNLPFKPKPAEDKKDGVGSHPFAGHMDLLFEGGDDEYDAGADDLNMNLAKDPEAAMAYSKRLIAEQSGEGKKLPFAQPPPKPAQPKKVEAKPPRRSPNKLRKKYAPPQKVDVLFDAEEDVAAEDDDWGNFEAGKGSLPKAAASAVKPKLEKQMPAIDLLGLDDGPEPTMPPASNGWTMSPSLQISPAAPTQPMFEEEYNSWSDFSSAPSRKPAITTTPLPTIDQAEEETWPDFDPPSPAQQPTSSWSYLLTPSITTLADPPFPLPSTLPPTNIPPPALLLSLIPPLFSHATTSLFDPLTKVSSAQNPAILAHPDVRTALRAYANLSTVLARLVAGRKLRWKRDKYLAQSSRIGPATAGGKSGGMKLAGLDKSEVAKEDREALDTVTIYRSSMAGKLRRAITAANGLNGAKVPLPIGVGERVPVTVLGEAEGGIRAPLGCCGVCGLRREERVAGEEGVDDSFGEWWVEGTGCHRSCWGFWVGERQGLMG